MCFATDSLFVFKFSVECCRSPDPRALDATAVSLSCCIGACPAGSIFVSSYAADAATVELLFCEVTDRLLLLCEMTLARAAPASSLCSDRAPGATCGCSWPCPFRLSMATGGPALFPAKSPASPPTPTAAVVLMHEYSIEHPYLVQSTDQGYLLMVANSGCPPRVTLSVSTPPECPPALGLVDQPALPAALSAYGAALIRQAGLTAILRGSAPAKSR